METIFKRWQIVEVRDFPDEKWVKAHYMEKTDDERYRAWEIWKSKPRKWKNCRPVTEQTTGDKEHKYHEEPKEEMKEWDYVYVSDMSEEHALARKDKKILLRKCSDGVVCIESEEDYREWRMFSTEAWNYAVPALKTITLEVTEEQEREINNILKK